MTSYTPITSFQRAAMLKALGVETVSDLLVDVPPAVRLNRPIALGEGMGELELVSALTRLANMNTPAGRVVSFAGAGCYDHYVPSVVDHVISRPEFFTAYTPYQPEASQGTLQGIFEYQTMVCELTGMDVSNASMYDGATALAEAALMARRITGRSAVICASSIHPEWQSTLATYAAAGSFEVLTAAFGHPGAAYGGMAEATGDSSVASMLARTDIAAVLVASPTFFGHFEDLSNLARMAHEAGALLVVAVNPILLGAFESPGTYGADVVVAEGQPLGTAMSFGGPGLGVFACRSSYLRYMPGRLVGKTVDAHGDPAYVLTLSTREQHIRREKATSNICSNHSLNALAAAVYLSAVGARGLREIALACVARARYLHDRLCETGRFTPLWDAPHAHEFVLRYDGDVGMWMAALLERGFLAGVDLSRFQREWAHGQPPTDLEGCVLFAVTERRSREEIDLFVREAASV